MEISFKCVIHLTISVHTPKTRDKNPWVFLFVCFCWLVLTSEANSQKPEADFSYGLT